MKATKLPSGSYRARVSVNGKRVSVTAPTKKEAEKKAHQILATESYNANNMSLNKAMQNYIASKDSVLSPSTLRSYKQLAATHYTDIGIIPINNITQDVIQNFINNKAKTHSPKTCRNIHGLLSAVLKQYRPEFILNTRLPQKQIIEEYIPTDDDIRILLSSTNGYLLDSIMLAVFGPMRRSEISALTSDDINGTIIHVHSAVVHSGSGWILKNITKTSAGDRYIDYPQFVIDRFSDRTGTLIPISPNAITERFHRALISLKLPLFRFHALRHYGASYLHKIGIPDAYIMQRGGWDSDYVMKSVYRHALSDEQKKVTNILKDNFENNFILDTKMDTLN